MMHIERGAWKGKKLAAHDPLQMRPTSSFLRDIMFDVLLRGHLLAHGMEDAVVLDLCCGTGILGWECLSLGAAYVLFVDKAQAARMQLLQNARMPGVKEPSWEFRQCPVETFLTRQSLAARHTSFDLIFFDPPYVHGSLLQEALPSLLHFLKKDGVLVIECSAKTSIAPPEGLALAVQKKRGKSQLLFLTKAEHEEV